MCTFYQLMGTVETKIMWMKSAWEDKKKKSWKDKVTDDWGLKNTNIYDEHEILVWDGHIYHHSISKPDFFLKKSEIHPGIQWGKLKISCKLCLWCTVRRAKRNVWIMSED